jgi:hypothetical protein
MTFELFLFRESFLRNLTGLSRRTFDYFTRGRNGNPPLINEDEFYFVRFNSNGKAERVYTNEAVEKIIRRK